MRRRWSRWMATKTGQRREDSGNARASATNATINYVLNKRNKVWG